MPFLSIIVPIYNAQEYLKTCLSSILDQTFQDFELILVNDGSTDNSRIICEEYERNNDKVIVINKKNGGLVSARKAGVKIARGEYVTYVDADDKVDIHMYADMCKEADERKADIVICDVLQWDGNLSMRIEQKSAGGVFAGKDSLKKNLYPIMLHESGFYNFGLLPAMWNKLYRADILKKNQELVDDRITIGEDVACSYFCILDADVVSYLKGKYYYYYRVNSNSMCHVWNSSKIDNISVLLDYLYRRLLEYNIEGMLKQYWYYFSYMYSNLLLEYCESTKKFRRNNDIISEFHNLLKMDIFGMFQNKCKELDIPKTRRVVIEYLPDQEKKSTIKLRAVIVAKKIYGYIYRIECSILKLLQ